MNNQLGYDQIPLCLPLLLLVGFAGAAGFAVLVVRGHRFVAPVGLRRPVNGSAGGLVGSGVS
jgi:hypothetical protein